MTKITVVVEVDLVSYNEQHPGNQHDVDSLKALIDDVLKDQLYDFDDIGALTIEFPTH